MGEFDLMVATVQLGTEFGHRGMDSHLVLLRRFYIELRERRAARARSRENGWDESMVISWLALLRIEPFDRVHPVLPKNAPCPKCGAMSARAAPAVFVRSVWPGGSLCQCRRCNALWLNEHPIGLASDLARR